MPKVSIITPCYNSAEFLDEVVASVQAQDMTDWEHIIINDGSSDNSAVLLQELAQKDARIKPLLLGENHGAARARNQGIKAAKGRYIAFLDADDLWEPEKLSTQIRFMQQGGHAFSFTSYRRSSMDGTELGVEHAPADLTYRQLLTHNRIGCLTAIYDSQMLGKVFMPDIRQRQDWGLWLALLQKTPKAYGLDRVLATHRLRKSSLSANKLISAGYTWQLYREVEGFSRLRSAWYFSHYATQQLHKIAKRRSLALF